jgi:hypothetical protein
MVSGLYWALPLVAVLAVVATPVSVPPSRILPDAQFYTLRANWYAYSRMDLLLVLITSYSTITGHSAYHPATRARKLHRSS